MSPIFGSTKNFGMDFSEILLRFTEGLCDFSLPPIEKRSAIERQELQCADRVAVSTGIR
jgi:hypothetical protein